MGVKSWREKRIGTLGGFSGNTLQRISTVAPVPVRGADVFSVKNTLGILVTLREESNTWQAFVSAGERGREGGRES